MYLSSLSILLEVKAEAGAEAKPRLVKWREAAAEASLPSKSWLSLLSPLWTFWKAFRTYSKEIKTFKKLTNQSLPKKKRDSFENKEMGNPEKVGKTYLKEYENAKWYAQFGP